MRIRTVKPQLFRHEDLYDAEQQSGLPLRLAFIGLLCAADKEGRFRWKPRRLKPDVLPYDELDFEQVLEALCRHGFIRSYTVGSERYGYFPTWKTHQRPRPDERESALPETPTIEIDAETDSSRNSDGPGTNPSPSSDEAKAVQSIGNREEGIGKRKKKDMSSSQAHSTSGDHDVLKVFDYWKDTHGHPRASLDRKRQRCILRALRTYTVDKLCDAISGYLHSPHHQGQTNGTKYDEITLFLRDAGHIEKGLELLAHPPRTSQDTSIADQIRREEAARS